MKQTTAEELNDLIIDELHKIEGCKNITSVQIIEQPGVPNWRKGSFTGWSGTDVTPSAEQAIKEIIERLQRDYELIADTV